MDSIVYTLKHLESHESQVGFMTFAHTIYNWSVKEQLETYLILINWQQSESRLIWQNLN